jgi:glycosyltransferase involved in cell wall biosynthesis
MLGDAIRSVLDQSFTNFEVFVSDNASTDDTAEVVASFDDPRVRYVRNDTNLGPLANMSRGFALGEAPLVTILPDDDLMLPGCLERKVRLLEEDTRIGLVHSAYWLVHLGPGNAVWEKASSTGVGRSIRSSQPPSS